MDIQHQRCLVNVRKEQGVVALLGLYFCLFNQYNSFFFLLLLLLFIMRID